MRACLAPHALTLDFCHIVRLSAGVDVFPTGFAIISALISWANQLDMSHAADLLGESLEEEKAAHEKLSALAESVNSTASSPGSRLIRQLSPPNGGLSLA